MRDMRKGQILAFALAFFMLPALSVMTSAQEAAPAVEIDCAPDPVMNVHPSYYEDVELLCIVSNPSSLPETISVEKEWDANNIEMILSEDSFDIEAGEEEEFTITFSGPTKLSADTSYSFTLNAQVDTWGGIVPVPVDQFNFNASYEGDFTVSTYGMVELEMSDKSVRTLELDEQRIISFQFSNYGNDEDKIRVSIANEAELLESGFSFPLGTFVAEDVASGGVSSIRDLTVSAPSVVTKEIRVQMVIRAESTNDDSAEFSEIVITLLVEKPSEISGLGGLDEMSTGDMKKYGAILGAGILGVFILVLVLKVVGRRSTEEATVRTIELPEVEEATKPDVEDLDEFDDMFDDLSDEEDDLDSFLNDL
ncbi:MAG: hypothetical protein GWO84_04320 [Euryarchaeota archaeon]|nr:hypothetical protein [Euryarchaeota archaeon]